MATDLSSALEQIDALRKIVTELQSNGQDAAAQRKACALARDVSVALEDEGDLVDRIIYSPADLVFINVAVELGLFELLAQSSKPLSPEELATATQADPVFLARILRGLATVGGVTETADGYSTSKIARAFTTTKGSSAAKVWHEFILPAWTQLPKVLAAQQYRQAPDHGSTAFSQATGQGGFEFLGARPRTLANFMTFMSSQRVGRPNFLDFYPVERELAAGFDAADAEAVMFVDVGGAFGEEIRELNRRFPDLPGRKVLQDLGPTIEHVKGEVGFEVAVHDFFTLQPLKGARAYYFRNVHHDWSDANSLKILRATIPAMRRGYSKILLNELVVPPRGASPFATRSDLNMMAMASSLERTEDQWRALLAAAGLKLAKIWTATEDSESIIEAVLP